MSEVTQDAAQIEGQAKAEAAKVVSAVDAAKATAEAHAEGLLTEIEAFFHARIAALEAEIAKLKTHLGFAA